MHDIAMRIRCTNQYCEVPPDDPHLAECVVEELLAHVLLTFFEVVSVQHVSLTLQPAPIAQPASISLSLQAQGYNPLPACATDYLDCALVEHISRALTELFGSLNVERFALQ